MALVAGGKFSTLSEFGEAVAAERARGALCKQLCERFGVGRTWLYCAERAFRSDPPAKKNASSEHRRAGQAPPAMI